MRRLFLPFIVLVLLAIAIPASAEDWTTADGKTYKNVVVIAQENDGVRITYTGGVGKIPYYELPLDLQKRFGEDYDSLEAKRIAAQKALEDATRNSAAAAAWAAEQKKEQDAAAAAQGTLHVNQPNGSSETAPAANAQQGHPSAGQPAQAAENSPYPGSKFSYDEANDDCYLDSPAIELLLVMPEAAPPPPNVPGKGTLTLRVTTEGHIPQTPDQIEATFLASDAFKKPAGSRDVKFLADGAYIQVDEIKPDDGIAAADASQVTKTISFYLSPAQAKTIFNAKYINFTIGGNSYRIDPVGMALIQKYFADVDRLPPASPDLIRSYHRFLARLPSIITVISTVCEYIILGSFGILVMVMVAGFAMGLSRFIKM